MGTRNVCVAVLVLLLPLHAHGGICLSKDGIGLLVTTTGTYFVCLWTVQLQTLDPHVCDASEGFLLVVRDYTIQHIFKRFAQIKRFHKDLWVGATLTPNGTVVDTDGEPLSFTMFDKDYPDNPAINTWVVLNKNWNFEWRNTRLNTSGQVHALCSDVDIQSLLPVTSDLSTISHVTTVFRLTDPDTTEPDPGTKQTNTGTSWYGLKTTRVDRSTSWPKGPDDVSTTTANPVTTLDVSNRRDQQISVTSHNLVSSTTSQTFSDGTMVNGQTKWTSTLNNLGSTESSGVFDTTFIDSTAGPLPVSTNGPLSVSSNGPLPVSTDEPLPVSTDSQPPVSTNGPLPVSTDEPLPVSTDGQLPVYTNEPLPESTPAALSCHISKKNHCCCVCSRNSKNITNVVEVLEKLREILTVDKASLSSTYRRKNSAGDNRNTSLCMGCVAIVVLGVIFIVVIFLDVSHLLFG